MKFSLLNLISLLTIIGLSIALIIALTKEQPPITVRSTHDTYSWRMTLSDLESSPVWPSSEKNPPLAVRDAISISNEIASDLNKATEKLNIGNWTFESLFLSPLDIGYTTGGKWCYVAQFTGTNRGLHVGSPHTMSMIILMDRTVLPGNGDLDRDAYAEIIKIYPF